MSQFDYLHDQDDSDRDAADWPPPGTRAEACPLCGGAGQVDVLDGDSCQLTRGSTCPECGGSGWASEEVQS